MAEYINKEAAVGNGYLSDWYISSVSNESPVWTAKVVIIILMEPLQNSSRNVKHTSLRSSRLYLLG